MDDMTDDPTPVVTERGTASQMAELYADLAAAQGEFQPILKNRSVSIDIRDKGTRQRTGSYTFRYADLEEITAKTRPALSKHGFATTQVISLSTAPRTGTSIFTRLLHKSGATIESEIPLVPAVNADIKEYGAAVTYLRRYAKSALLDISADDDLDESGREGGEDKSAREPEAESQAEPETYSQDMFEKNLPGWTAAVSKRRTTPETILKMLATKAPLTEKQRAIILALQVETAQ